MDKVSKRRRPKAGVAERIKAFLKDEEVLISAIATGMVFKGNVINGVTFEEAIYKFGRTSIAHEGELNPRLQFVDGGSWSIGDKWLLPASYILGLSVAVMAAPECGSEHIASDSNVTLFGRQWAINELWGAEREIKTHIATKFGEPRLFS